MGWGATAGAAAAMDRHRMLHPAAAGAAVASDGWLIRDIQGGLICKFTVFIVTLLKNFYFTRDYFVSPLFFSESWNQLP